jgi:hypothetical protein
MPAFTGIPEGYPRGLLEADAHKDFERKGTSTERGNLWHATLDRGELRSRTR